MPDNTAKASKPTAAQMAQAAAVAHFQHYRDVMAKAAATSSGSAPSGRITAGGGYYDENGTWVQTKFCFISCGERCDCTPPGGVYQLPKPEATPEP